MSRVLGEVRRAEQLPLHVVGPAVQRADDVLGVAAPLEQDRLAMAADVRKELYPPAVPHQNLAVVHPGKRVIVARVRHHQLVPYVAGSGIEQQLLFQLEYLRVEVPGNGKLRSVGLECSRTGQVGHAVGKLLKLGQ